MTRSASESQLTVDSRAVSSIRKGHPWIWRHAIAIPPRDLAAGSSVTAVDDHGQFLAYGLWDPSSPIAVRVYSRAIDHPISLDLLTQGVQRAMRARFDLFDHSVTNAYRVCNGEGDRVPGVVIDRYDCVCVARFDGAAIRAWSEPLLERLWPRLREQGIKHLVMRTKTREKKRVQTIAGPPMPQQVVVREHGMHMLVDLIFGQKTGAFLDQRDNRYRVRAMAKTARVLNLFSYTAGFSCAAALGGARHVTSVDIARDAHDIAEQTFRLNQLDPSNHAFIANDVFAYLDAARSRGERFDLIISDPPSFAPNEKSVSKALNAYRRVHQGCSQLLAEGGTLCAASCSSHVTMDAFVGTLDDDTMGDRPLRVASIHGQPEDHPTTASWQEGRYLKFVVLRDAN